MVKFLQDASLYAFVGVVTVLVTMMVGCFLYYKGKTFIRKGLSQNMTRTKKRSTIKRGTSGNKFLMKRGEKADVDEEGGAAETDMDKIRAIIDAKYNNPDAIWMTSTSGEPSPVVEEEEEEDNEVFEL